MKVSAYNMPRDPRKTWEYFAKAAIQEEDPDKLTHLIQELYRALAEDDKRLNPKPLQSEKAA